MFRYSLTVASGILLLLALFRSFPALGQMGLVDVSFNSGSGPNGPVAALVVLPNQSIMIAGSFTEVDGVSREGIARLNSDGRLDTSFDVRPGPDGSVQRIAALPDGKVIVSGPFTKICGTSHNGMARLNVDGSLDKTFNVGSGNPQSSIHISAEGKVLLLGTFWSVQGFAVAGLAQLNFDGSVDTNFHPFPASIGLSVSTASLQSDGRLLIAGTFRRTTNQAWRTVGRLLPDGSDDLSFQPPVPFTGAVGTSVYALSDGKVLYTEFVGYRLRSLLRLHPNGTIDETFSAPLAGAIAALPAPDGRVLAYSTTGFLDSPPLPLFRLGSQGSRDWTFDLAPFYFPQSLGFQADGKLVIGGSFTEIDGVPRPYLARLYESNPRPVFHFTNSTYVVSESNEISTVEIIRGGPTNLEVSVGLRTLDGTALAGEDYVTDMRRITFAPGEQFKRASYSVVNDQIGPEADKIFRITLEHPSVDTIIGTPAAAAVTIDDDDLLDQTFNPMLSGANWRIWRFVVEPDGKIVIAGFFTSVHGIPRTNFARINPEGTLDPSFDKYNRINVAPMVLRRDDEGRFLISANATTLAGTEHKGVTRLHPDGSIDLSFIPGPIWRDGTNYDLTPTRQLALQPDGKILYYGRVSNPDTLSEPTLLRLNTDGSEDTSFVQRLGFLSNSITALAVQQSGGIIVGSTDNPHKPVTRLLDDGSEDPEFDGTLLRGLHVRTLTLQADDKILVTTGYYSCWSGYPSVRLIRLNVDGTLDTSFHEPLFGAYLCHEHQACDVLTLDAVAVQSDGKIVVGGTFMNVNGMSPWDCGHRALVVRLNPDGSLDYDFHPFPIIGGGGIFPFVYALGVDANNKVIVAGSLQVLRPYPAAYFFRLNAGSPLVTQAQLGIMTSNGIPQLTARYNGSAYFVIEASANLVNWLPILTNTQWRVPISYPDLDADTLSQRFYRVRPW